MRKKAYFRRIAVWLAVLAVVLEVTFVCGFWVLGNWPPAPFTVWFLIGWPAVFVWLISKLLVESNKHSD